MLTSPTPRKVPSLHWAMVSIVWRNRCGLKKGIIPSMMSTKASAANKSCHIADQNEPLG